MKCPSCKKSFQENQADSRVLGQCGHAICDSCARRLFKEGIILCPQCHSPNYVHSVASLPKIPSLNSASHKEPRVPLSASSLRSNQRRSNLLGANGENSPNTGSLFGQFETMEKRRADSPGLLSIASKGTRVHEKHQRSFGSLANSFFIEQNSFPLTNNQSFNSEITSNGSLAVCPRHLKAFEFYCEKIKRLLCPGCLLENGNKNHELISIEAAAQQERALIDKADECGRLLKVKLLDMQQEVKNAIGFLENAALLSIKMASQLFEEFRKCLEEKELEAKSRILEQKEIEEESLLGQHESVKRHLSVLETLFDQAKEAIDENDFALLSSSQMRHELVKQATGPIDKLRLNIPFKDLQVEKELEGIWSLVLRRVERVQWSSLTQVLQNSPFLNQPHGNLVIEHGRQSESSVHRETKRQEAKGISRAKSHLEGVLGELSPKIGSSSLLKHLETHPSHQVRSNIQNGFGGNLPVSQFSNHSFLEQENKGPNLPFSNYLERRAIFKEKLLGNKTTSNKASDSRFNFAFLFEQVILRQRHQTKRFGLSLKEELKATRFPLRI